MFNKVLAYFSSLLTGSRLSWVEPTAIEGNMLDNESELPGPLMEALEDISTDIVELQELVLNIAAAAENIEDPARASSVDTLQ